ncbi:acyl-CoA N-acyltransferase [Scheffersomyces xylosifermentans]|uniref:acyl-CoA N-acyltransferase n=1 Tax=Scheffersomyces xylosifermentans TaxID=1304137 RepID=UPI00315D0387
MTLPEGYSLRKLKESDYDNQYIDTLKVLTTVGEISSSQFSDLFKHWEANSSIYHPYVITNSVGSVVSTGMLLVEKKLIHGCGSVGHIEDISVASSEQGKRLGSTMVAHLAELSKELGCYKVILDCSEHNVKFYEKGGFKNEGVEMCKRFD